MAKYVYELFPRAKLEMLSAASVTCKEVTGRGETRRNNSLLKPKNVNTSLVVSLALDLRRRRDVDERFTDEGESVGVCDMRRLQIVGGAKEIY